MWSGPSPSSHPSLAVISPDSPLVILRRWSQLCVTSTNITNYSPSLSLADSLNSVLLLVDRKRQNLQTAAGLDEINPAFYKPHIFLYTHHFHTKLRKSNLGLYKFTHQVSCQGKECVKTTRSWPREMILMYRWWECMRADLQGMLATTAPGHEACHLDVLCLVIISHQWEYIDQSEACSPSVWPIRGPPVITWSLSSDCSDIRSLG